MQEAREFEVTIVDSKEIHELPRGWPPERLQAVLARLEVDGVSDDEAPEMAPLALQDLDVDDASDVVLEVIFGDRMRPGVRQNLIPDLREDRPWDEFAEISQQADIFEAVVLLQRAFPHEFGKPDALSMRVRFATGSASAAAWLDAPTPDAGLLLRILAGGMDDRAVLRRLFEESLAGEQFPEAASILWRAVRQESPTSEREFALISSHQWLEPLADTGRFSTRAWPDAAAEDGD